MAATVKFCRMEKFLAKPTQTKLNYQCLILGWSSACFGLVNYSLGKTSTPAFVIFRSCSHFTIFADIDFNAIFNF